MALEFRRNTSKECSKSKTRHAQHHRNRALKVPNSSGCSAKETTSNSTSSLNSVAKEVCSTLALDSVIQSQLTPKQDALRETTSVRYIRLEGDIRRNNITCAGGAESGFREIRLEKEECNVGGGESSGIGDHIDRIGRRYRVPKILLNIFIHRSSTWAG